MNKKRGFTLSETLITLAIIGVVAALTLPTMIANHRKKVYVVQLQKAVSTLEQGFKMMMADDAVDKFCYTTMGSLCTDNDCYAGMYNEEGEATLEDLSNGYDIRNTKLFMNGLKKYFSVSEISSTTTGYTWYNIDGSLFDEDVADYYGAAAPFVKLSDGTWFTFWLIHCYSDDGLVDGDNDIIVDVNGAKGPNTWGRDIFHLRLQEDGTFKGYGSSTKKKCLSDGQNCASYLMNNGWVMDY